MMIERSTPYRTPRPAGAPARIIRGVVLHHTGGMTAVPCHANGSWHYAIDRDGTIYADVPEADVAWHVRAADRWRPDWLARGCSWAACSDVNTTTIGIEIVSAAGVTPITDAQHDALRSLSVGFAERYGSLWYVGHGELQTDRRTTEPDNLDWSRIGCGPFDPRNGRPWHNSEAEDMTNEERELIKAVRETGYPATEAAEVIRLFAGISANRSSVDLWVSQIGALSEQVRKLTGTPEPDPTEDATR